MTRSRVSEDIRPVRLTAFDAVFRDTPACSATEARVTVRRGEGTVASMWSSMDHIALPIRSQATVPTRWRAAPPTRWRGAPEHRASRQPTRQLVGLVV